MVECPLRHKGRHGSRHSHTDLLSIDFRFCNLSSICLEVPYSLLQMSKLLLPKLIQDISEVKSKFASDFAGLNVSFAGLDHL